MSYLDQFLDLLSSPYGLLGILVGLFVLTRTHETHRRLHWFLFALCGFTASLSKHIDRWGREVPDLAFPLEQLREMGRPLAIFSLGLLLLIAFRSRQHWRFQTIPSPIPYLVVVQIVIVFKTLQYGSITFALITAATFGSVVLMIIKGPSRWLQDERNFQLGVWSIATIGTIFILASLYQASISISPMTFFGTFSGTTGNPQQASTLLMGIIPCYLFFVQQNYKSKKLKWIWTGLLILAGLALILTGSRTGLISGIFGLLLFYRYRGGQFLRLVFTVAVVIVIVSFLLPSQTEVVEVGQPSIGTSLEQISSRVDTRTDVWQTQWQIFMNYPLLGAPLRGERFSGYGESSWLGAGSALGLLGFIPLVLFGLESMKMILRLDRLAIRHPKYYLHCSVVIAGLGAALLGSFAEAYLLGNITGRLLILLLYQCLGTYLLDLNRKEQLQNPENR